MRVALLPLPSLVAAALCVLGSCDGQGPRQYDQNDLQLLTSYAAKEICSCVFVMGRDDDFCGAWATASPNLRTYAIDHDKKRVTAQAVLFWGRSAHYAGPGNGCVLE